MRRLPVLKSMVREVAARLVQSERIPPTIRHGIQTSIDSVKAGIESRRQPSRPQSINVEVTAICDARCIHCPRHEMDRSQRPMKLELFKKLVDEAAAMEVPEICPNGYGEALTMQNLGEYIAYIRTTKHRFFINVNTNGFRLTDEKIEMFLDHEVDLLNLTIDGATAETFEAVRVNLKLDVIEDNVRRFLARRRERGLRLPRIRIGMILIPQNEHEAQAFLDKWRALDGVDYVGIGGFTNRGGSLDASFEAPSKSVAPLPSACALPFSTMNIWADGKAVLCCDDWNAEQVVGDLNTQSLSEIWTGPGLTDVRRKHMAGQGAQIDLCRSCNFWRPVPSTARLWA